MYKKKTEFNLEQLSRFIPLILDQNISTVSSFEFPTIELIAREIGVILITTIQKEEKEKAENNLVELLEHPSDEARQMAYFFFLEYGVLDPSSFSENSQKALRKFETKPCNVSIVKDTLAII